MDSSDIDRIRHIKCYCDDIAETIDRFGDSLDTFSRDTDYYKSVSMSIMQIGEITTGLSESFKKATRAMIPWELIKGMRNHFAHGYATMEKSDIWETATKDIPYLLHFCESIIEENTTHDPAQI